MSPTKEKLVDLLRRVDEALLHQVEGLDAKNGLTARLERDGVVLLERLQGSRELEELRHEVQDAAFALEREVTP